VLRKSKKRPKTCWVDVEAHVKIDPGMQFKPQIDELRAAIERSDILEDRQIPLIALRDVIYRCKSWIRSPGDWNPKSHNSIRQFSSLLRHLFCRYDVPVFMDHAWTDKHCSEGENWQDWFILMGSGQNIRTAQRLPISLTKKQAHFFCLAPDDSTIPQAFRYGQVLGMGGTPRLAGVISTSILGGFHEWREAFWETVIRWFINQRMFDYNQVGPIIDFINHERFDIHPNLTMHGRTVDSVIKQMEVWHRILRRSKNVKNLEWNRCSIEEFTKIDGNEKNQKRFELRELLSSRELKAEGSAMCHCVYSYAQSCFSRNVAIFSLKKNEARLATIEVNLRTKQIVQTRAKYNESISVETANIIRMWASRNGLSIYSYCRL
jgi:hypothetical protein